MNPEQRPNMEADPQRLIAEKSRLAHEYLRHGALVREAALRDAVRGNKNAFARLLHEAGFWNAAVEEARIAQPEIARQLAAARSVWPGNVAGHPAAVDSAVSLLRELGLGSALKNRAVSSVPWKGRKRLDSPAQEIAIDFHDWIARTRRAGVEKASTETEREACELPAIIDTNTGRQSFECAWRHFVADNGGDVLRNPAAEKIAGKTAKGRNSPEGYVKQQVLKACGWIPKT